MKDTEERVMHSLRVQEMNPESVFFGGFYDDNGMVQAKYAIYRVASMIATYCNEESKFFHSKLIYQRISLGLSYIKSQQHRNGLFDYITCNFYSAPDTAFCVRKLLPIFEYLRQREKLAEGETIILQEVENIVKKGGYGLVEGGFHTPNHRWVIASVLAKVGVLFQEDALIQAAYCYLKEGIDCNEDGEFSEKSAGNYNRINNDAMILLTESLGEEKYVTYAKKNLNMMLTYWEPDGSIFTANSTRFDKDRLIFPKDYYIQYLTLGIKYEIPEFLGMCNTIFDLIDEKRLTAPDCLISFMLDKRLRDVAYESRYIRADFKKFYKESGIVRAQIGRCTYTVMKEKSNFLYFQSATIKLEMKLAGSFCEHRAFQAEEMNQMEDGSIHLHETMRGWYYLPFEEEPPTSDWWRMDHTKRKKKLGPNMDIDIFIREAERGIDVRIRTNGVTGAPWRVELAISGIDRIASDHVRMPIYGDEILVIKDEKIEACNKEDCFIIGPGFGVHRFTEGKEDSERKTPGVATLYFTDYTGFDRTIHIRNKWDMEEELFARNER